MRDLIVFGEDWGGHPSSTQHLIRRLLGDHRVIWINSIGMRRPRLDRRDLRRVWQKLLAQRKPTPARAHEGVQPILVAPRWISWPGSRMASWLNRRLLGHQLRSTMAKHGVQRPVLWLSLPAAVDIVGALNESAVVYYCGDDFSALDGVDHAAAAAAEVRLAEQADLILVVSTFLAAKFPPVKTRLLPHGVDVDTFRRPACRAQDLPAGVPVAGFYGSISNWLDQPLIAECAVRLSGWEFVFIGPIRTDVSMLSRQRNIRFLGERDHKALAGYSQFWDASLLPFLNTPQIRACNPLKLREYLAAGSPVVTTDFPALDGYRDLVTIASSADEFVAALNGARQEGRNRAALRQQRVAGETWEARADQLRQWLDEVS